MSRCKLLRNRNLRALVQNAAFLLLTATVLSRLVPPVASFHLFSVASINFAPHNLNIHIGVGSGVQEMDDFDSLVAKMPQIDY